MANGVNKAGQDWLVIRRWINNEIENATRLLVATSEKDELHRGEIAVLRRLIDLVEPEELPEISEENYG